MTLILLGVLVLAIWLARPRTLLPRERGLRVSDRWRLEHLYTDGKHGHL